MPQLGADDVLQRRVHGAQGDGGPAEALGLLAPTVQKRAEAHLGRVVATLGHLRQQLLQAPLGLALAAVDHSADLPWPASEGVATDEGAHLPNALFALPDAASHPTNCRQCRDCVGMG